MAIRADRRTMFKIAGGGAALVAAPQILTRAASAQIATAEEVGNAGHRSFRLGDYRVTAVLDGGRAMDGPHPIFGQNQDAADVAALMEENHLPAERFVNGFVPVIVESADEVVLFDTGLGEGAREAGLGQLRQRMQAAGHAPEDVTIVVLTHLHPDHIGGLTEGGEPAFPNARYMVGRAEYDFWTADERSQGATANAAANIAEKVVPLMEDATMLAEGDEVTAGITAMEAFGHTPGHLVFNIESAGRRLMLTADTANHFVASLQRPDWHVQYDMDKEAAAETRRRVFDMIAADGIPFIGYHMPFPAVGFAEKLERGYRFVPATYQFDV